MARVNKCIKEFINANYHTLKCASNSMWLPDKFSTTSFLGSKVDGKEDKGNSIQSSNLNPWGRDLMSSQITL